MSSLFAAPVKTAARCAMGNAPQGSVGFLASERSSYVRSQTEAVGLLEEPSCGDSVACLASFTLDKGWVVQDAALADEEFHNFRCFWSSL